MYRYRHTVENLSCVLTLQEGFIARPLTWRCGLGWDSHRYVYVMYNRSTYLFIRSAFLALESLNPISVS